MMGYNNKIEDFGIRSIFSFLAILVIFIFDSLTPLGFAAWILYMVPISLTPYRTIDRPRIYLISSIITVLIWSGFYIKPHGTLAPQIALANRAFITLVLWTITYVQIQRSKAHKDLLKYEEELRKSEERFRIAQEHSPDGFTLFHPVIDKSGKLDFVFTFENYAAGKLIGYKPQEVIGRTLLELFPSSIDTQFYYSYKKAYETNNPIEFEDYYAGEGVEKWLRMLIIPSNGEIAAISQDISQRKKTEEALRKSEERFRLAQEVSPDGFVTFIPKIDAQGQVVDFIFTFENEAAAKMNGTKPEEVIGKGLLELFPGQKDTQFFRAYKEVYKTQKIIEFIDHYKGETFKDDIWFRVLAVPTSEGIAINAQNITEQKRSEEALRESQIKLLEAQKLARLGNYSIDFKNGGKMEWSDEMYNIWEVKKNEPFPTVDEVWKRVHPDDLEELKRVLYSQLPGGERVETIFRILFPGNRVKYVHIITRVTFDENGILSKREGIEMDITERKMAQIELERTLQKLERSNEELKQFAYVASHDLQEPLRMISNYMTMLEKKYSKELDDRAKQFISFAVDGSKRMSNLIRDLLAYSRVTTQAKEFTDVDLNKTFIEVTRDLQVLIKEKGAKIISTKLPLIKADPVQMHQLLQNIIGNAIKFQSERTPLVNISAKEIENGWLFSIKDNGIGIDPQFYDRIFQVFQRLHEQGKYPGTGIGLAVCQKIVERHGGRIWVESELGKGTTFYFTIPETNRLTSPEDRDNIKILGSIN